MPMNYERLLSKIQLHVPLNEQSSANIGLSFLTRALTQSTRLLILYHFY